MKACRCRRTGMQQSLYRDASGRTRCGRCRGVRSCLYRNRFRADTGVKRKFRLLDFARRQGEARLKRWLRAQLQRLRAEMEEHRPKSYDMDDQSQGYEAALDNVEELLAKRRRA